MGTLSVVGLGKLGLCQAACLAYKGYEVIGVDVNPKTVEKINAGQSPIVEPRLNELLQACEGRLQATADYEDAVRSSEVTFIVVPTPSSGKGVFSLRYVKAAVESIGVILRHKADYHVVVVTSTVMPGSTDFAIKPLLEAQSAKQCGVDFGLCYNPEFIALGDVIRGLLTPDYVLVGESDPRAGEHVASIYERMCENQPPIARMSFVNAELTKLASNCFDTTKITFANMIAGLCERLPGGDVDVVTQALGWRNKGTRFLKGAIPYGGPCFPRDNVALASLAQALGYPARLTELVHNLNQEHAQRLFALVQAHRREGLTVGVVGLSYKPNTPVIEEAFGTEMARQLAMAGVPVVVYDPLAMESARTLLGDSVAYAASLEECVDRCDLLVLANALPELRTLQWTGRRPSVIVDCWRALDRQELPVGVEYVAVGLADAQVVERSGASAIVRVPEFGLERAPVRGPRRQRTAVSQQLDRRELCRAVRPDVEPARPVDAQFASHGTSAAVQPQHHASARRGEHPAGQDRRRQRLDR